MEENAGEDEFQVGSRLQGQVPQRNGTHSHPVHQGVAADPGGDELRDKCGEGAGDQPGDEGRAPVECRMA